MRLGLLSLTASALLLALAPASAQDLKIRIATQAPEGTVWLDALQDIKKTVDKGTKGRVKLEYFPNGTQGDEKAVIERMENGVLHGGLFTGIGLGEILPAVRILEVPFLYENRAEIVAVRDALEPEFTKGFAEKGFTFLGWAEVGWAYIFSKEKAANLAGLRERKIWMWQGDPLAEKVFKAFGLSGVPLPLTDVLTSLQTGMIDSVYNSPYGLVGLQWHRPVKYMSRMNVGHGTGALLVTSKQWDKIRKSWRPRFVKVARQRLDKLLGEVESKNEETIKELQEAGTRVIPIPSEEMPTYKKLGAEVADSLCGKLWSKELLVKVRKILADLRAKK